MAEAGSGPAQQYPQREEGRGVKSLELVIYPKMGSIYFDEEANHGRSTRMWSTNMADGLADEKRLTDGDLAAEYFNAEAQQRTIALHMEGIADLPVYERAWEIQDRLYDFATQPNYDDPEPTQ